MPTYTGPDDAALPEAVRMLPPGRRARWVAVANVATASRATAVIAALDEAVDALTDVGVIETAVVGGNLQRIVVCVKAGDTRAYVEVAADAPPVTLALVDNDGVAALPEGTHIDRVTATTPGGTEAAILDYAARLVEQQEVEQYAVVKADQVRRYTLGVAYPAAELDSHRDYTTAEDLELAAWNYMARYRNAGVMHEDGTDGAGVVVESYIYRGPVWKAEGQEIGPGDWLLGVVWDEPTWSRIRAGELTGFSIQGTALAEAQQNTPAP